MNRAKYISGIKPPKGKYFLGRILGLKKEYWDDEDRWGHGRVKEIEIIGWDDVKGQWIIVATERLHPDAARTPGPLELDYLDKYYE
jgi:hypothetical protein